MSSEYAIKKANHQKHMEMLDRSFEHQVRTKKDNHRQEMSELRNRHTVEKAELQQTQNNQLENLKQKNDTYVQRERLSYQDRLAKQKLQAQQDYQKTANEKARENARLRRQAQVERDQSLALRDQARRQSMETKRKSEHDLEQIDKESRFKLRQKQAQLQERQQTIQSSYNKEVQRIEQTGQENIKDRRHKNQQIEVMQKKEHQQALAKDKNQFEALSQRQHDQYNKKLDHDEQFFQDQLKSQQKEYSKRYQENEKFSKASFQNQKNRLAEEMFKLKKDFITTAHFYQDRAQDPFYSLVDFGAEFKEGEAYYEVTAQVPEHEMKNVRVHIQPNVISLHATRQHEQEFKAQNEKIGSNIAQTIRQEFKLDKPADFEKAIKTYKDGTLTILVPKKGYYQFGPGQS